jgi:hypothetical protein
MSNKEAFLSIFGLRIKHNHDKLDAIKKIPICCKKNFNRLPFDIIVKYKFDAGRFKKKSFKNIIIMNYDDYCNNKSTGNEVSLIATNYSLCLRSRSYLKQLDDRLLKSKNSFYIMKQSNKIIKNDRL